MNWRQLAAIANQHVLTGLGAARVCLDKRGLDLMRQEIELTLPPDGERFSADGTIGYLSGRVTE